MSFRRSLSFAEDEQELLEYFDENGKSDIAKESIKFYKQYKDRVITDTMIDLIKTLSNNELIQLPKENIHYIPKPNYKIQEKLLKLRK